MGYLKNFAPCGGCANCSDIVVPCIGSAAPVITSSSTLAAARGSSVGFAVTATNSPIFFSWVVGPGGGGFSAGMPPGLTMDTYSGLISGCPSVALLYDTIVRAHNGCGVGSHQLIVGITAGSACGGGGCAFTGVSSFVSTADDGECINDTFDVTGEFSSATAVVMEWNITGGSASIVVKANGTTIFSGLCQTGDDTATFTVPSGTTSLQIITTCGCAESGGAAIAITIDCPP